MNTNWQRILPFVGLFVGLGILVAFAAPGFKSRERVSPQAAEQPATASPTEALTDIPSTETPAATVEATAASDESACLDCHSDAETLQLLALEEEAGEALSSGEG
jgi:hypothetical protein